MRIIIQILVNLFLFFLIICDPDPIDCRDCHLTWLIRDNRHLLTKVYGGQCSNGTSFEELDPQGFADCPVSLILSNFLLTIFP